MARATKIREETLVQAAQEGIQENDIYSLVDYPIGGITNAQMTAALTQAQDGFYQVNSVFMCLDSGTYAQNHFYKFNTNSWVDVTPEFPGEIVQTTLSQLEGQTIDDDAIYSVSDYPIGGITQAQMNAAITPQQLGFYQVGSVYLCTDSGNDYIQNHFYKFSYDDVEDEYYWYDTHAGADVDSDLSLVSTNPVENRVITNALNDKVSLTGNENIDGLKTFSITPKVGANELNLPTAYQQVEYIQSSGNAYINTRVSNYTNLDLDFQPVDIGTNDSTYYFGNRPEDNANRFAIMRYNGNFHFMIGNGGYWNKSVTTDRYQVSLRRGLLKVKNVTTSTESEYSTNATYSPTTGNLYLFAANYNGTNFYSNQKLYSCKFINDSDVVTKHFIPCYKKSTNEIGLYDIIGDTFYTNAGSGTFIVGPDVTVNVDVALITDVNSKVSLTGDETIQGIKTFEDRPLVGTTSVGVALQTEIPEIEANNQETTTETLTKLKINGINYAISGGGGGSTVTMRDWVITVGE